MGTAPSNLRVPSSLQKAVCSLVTCELIKSPLRSYTFLPQIKICLLLPPTPLYKQCILKVESLTNTSMHRKKVKIPQIIVTQRPSLWILVHALQTLPKHVCEACSDGSLPQWGNINEWFCNLLFISGKPPRQLSMSVRWACTQSFLKKQRFVLGPHTSSSLLRCHEPVLPVASVFPSPTRLEGASLHVGLCPLVQWPRRWRLCPCAHFNCQ